MLRDIKLREIMASPAITVKVEDLFSKVEEKLRMKGIRHLPVVDDEGRLVGLVSQRDLYRTLAPRKTEEGSYYDIASLNEFILKRVMTENPTSLGPDDPVSKAVELMAAHKYGAIPLVDSGRKVVGIVTEIDILKWLARQF